MGTTVAFVGTKRQPRHPGESGEALSAPTEWSVEEVSHRVPLARLYTLVAARVEHVPAILAYVQDGDFAFLAAYEGKHPPSCIVVNMESALEYEEGVWALAECQRTSETTEWQQEAARRFAAWSKHAPQAIRPEQVERVLARKWVDAIGAVEQLFRALELPVPFQSGERFGEAVWVMDSGRTRLPSGEISLDEARYVLGWGSDFIGIWDREAPQSPSERFPKTAEGEQSAWKRWLSLVRNVQPR